MPCTHVRLPEEPATNLGLPFLQLCNMSGRMATYKIRWLHIQDQWKMLSAGKAADHQWRGTRKVIEEEEDAPQAVGTAPQTAIKRLAVRVKPLKNQVKMFIAGLS